MTGDPAGCAPPEKRAFSFPKALLNWFARDGRYHLPWQQEINPYRVWVSEIMLQQTQVATVIPYFERFISTLPDIHALAAAPVDQVLQLWTGLGYYSRARNLHRTARIITTERGGHFPDTLESLEALPGIGRSTAGAILSIAMGKRAAILDGNVKRVLARYHGIEGWPGEARVAAELWAYAEQHTPSRDVGKYTQAIMDLGALVCTRTRPDCGQCPLQQHCTAFREGHIAFYPGKKPRKILPVRSVQLLMLRNTAGAILLQQRPPSGIWGGLWCFPEVDALTDPVQACQKLCGKKPRQVAVWDSWRHTFSHYHLDITPVLLDVSDRRLTVHSESPALWLDPQQNSPAIGLAAPTCKLLNQLAAC